MMHDGLANYIIVTRIRLIAEVLQYYLEKIFLSNY